MPYLWWNKVVYKLDVSNGAIFNGLEWSPNPDFKGTPLFYVECLRNSTRRQLQWNTECYTHALTLNGIISHELK